MDFFNSDFFNVYLNNFYNWLNLTEIGRLTASFLIIIFALLIRGVFSFIIVKLLDFVFARKLTSEARDFVSDMGAPISFIPVVVGVYFALDILKVPPFLLFYTRNFLKSIYIFNIAWFVYTFVNPIAFAFKKLYLDKTKNLITTWIARVIKFIIFIVAMSAILEQWGVSVGAIVASLGLVGAAVALGAQDMFKNIISGVAILSEHRFSVGDIIKLENADMPIEGIVVNIGFRSTLIKKFDRSPLYVPNSVLADAAIINYSAKKHRRIKWNLALEYRATHDQLLYVRSEIEKYILENDDFVRPPDAPVHVRLSQFSSSSVDIVLNCFTNTNVWSDYLRIKEALMFKIKKIMEEAGVHFALPATSIYIEKVDEDLNTTELSKKLKTKMAKNVVTNLEEE